MPNDKGRIMQIIGQAQRRMAAAGSEQWQDGYPGEAIIVDDIANGYGYVAECDGVTVAYAAISANGEAAYEELAGEWLTSGRYIVVHRLAVCDEAVRRGIATSFMAFAEEMANDEGLCSVRVDTNFDNRGMLTIFERRGYRYCGTVQYQSGQRVAYELIIRPNII